MQTLNIIFFEFNYSNFNQYVALPNLFISIFKQFKFIIFRRICGQQSLRSSPFDNMIMQPRFRKFDQAGTSQIKQIATSDVSILLKQIGVTMKQRGLQSFINLIETHQLNDTLVVPVIEFIRLLTGSIFKLSQSDASKISKAFIVSEVNQLRQKMLLTYQEPEMYIDILSFDYSVAQQFQQSTNDYQDLRNQFDIRVRSQELIAQFKQAVQLFMAKSGTDIFKVFQMIDTDGQQNLTEQELQQAVQFLNLNNFSNQDVKILFQTMDINNDGKVSVYEFSQKIQETCQQAPAIKESQFTNPIIEQVRRYLFDRREQENIFQIFGVDRSSQIQGQPILCDSNQFEQVLKHKMLIYCQQQYFDQLVSAITLPNDQRKVNLIQFIDLIGVVDYECTEFGNKQSHQHHLKCQKHGLSDYQIFMKDLKVIINRLQELQISENFLRMEFQNYSNNQFSYTQQFNSLITVTAFIQALQQISESNDGFIIAPIPQQVFQSVADKFIVDTNQVDFELFIQEYTTHKHIQTVLSYLNEKIKQVLQKQGLSNHTFQEFLRLEGINQTSITMLTLKEILRKHSIIIQDNELYLFQDLFDLSGTGQTISIDELQSALSLLDNQKQNLIKNKKNIYSGLSIADQRTNNNQQDYALQDLLSRIRHIQNQQSIDIGQILANQEKIMAKRNNSKYPVNFTGFMEFDAFELTLKNYKIEFQSVEKTILRQNYKSDSQQSKNQFNYQAFVNDLNSLAKDKFNNAQFSKDQMALIDKLRSKTNLKNIPQKIAISCKQIDRLSSGFLTQKKLPDVFNQNQIVLDQTELVTLKTCLKFNAKGDFLIKEFLVLLFQEELGNQLHLQDVQSLQDIVKENQKAVTGKFVVPKSTQGALDKQLESIGLRLIQTGKNYEETLIGITGQFSSAYPQITSKQFQQALEILKIQLRQQEQFSMESFFKNNSSSQNQQVQLATLLKAIGLTPQTFGKEVIIQQTQIRILSQKELDQCHKILTDLFQKAKQDNFDLKKLFPLSPDNTDDNLDPRQFISLLKEYFLDFVKFNQVDNKQVQEILLLYLQDKEQGQISKKRLKLAYERKRTAKPLEQIGVEQQLQYIADIKDQIGKAKDEDEIKNLVKYMIDKGLTVKNLLVGSKQVSNTIPRDQFERALKQIGYAPSIPMEQFLDLMVDKNNPRTINLTFLQDRYKKSGIKKVDQSNVYLQNMPQKVQIALKNIQKYLQQNNISLEEFHKNLDKNKDGVIVLSEWKQQLRQFNIPGIQESQLGFIFEALDVNNDGQLSLNEMSLFIKGMEIKKEALRKQLELDTEFMQDCHEQIQQLFNIFDTNNDQKIDDMEVMKTLRSFNIYKNKQECTDLIKQYSDRPTLNKQQFNQMMLPLMINEILEKKDNIQDLRALFLEADVDGSGFLDVSELYAAIKKMGADITEDELAVLMAEIDVDKNSVIDIDEFIQLMTLGDQIDFENQKATRTFMQIQKARRLNPTDFVKLFKDMPISFVPSFIYQLWKKPTCLPSYVFKAQVDPATMLWKDVRELRSDKDMLLLDSINPKGSSKPYMRPIDSTIAAEIKVIDANGVPLPQDKNGFQENQIVRRVLNIGIMHIAPKQAEFKEQNKPEFMFNAIQIPADWKSDNKDIWTFQEQQMSQVIFRTTSQDRLDKGKTKIVFELVSIFKPSKDSPDSCMEMSCGWSSIDIQDLVKAITIELPISGGNPQSEMQIAQDDVRAERSGLNAVKKVLAGGIVEKRLKIQITPLIKLPPDVRYHITMMPSTCLVQRNLLHFLSGFMNYKAKKLLEEQVSGVFKKPAGDTVICTLPCILDCPEIIENLQLIWKEDVDAEMKKAKAEMDIPWIVRRMKDYVCRLYGIIYSGHFEINKIKNPTYSACGDKKQYMERVRLVESALRYGQTFPIKPKDTKFEAPADMTTFKPFSMNEMEFEIWDSNTSKQDQFLMRLDQKKNIYY